MAKQSITVSLDERVVKRVRGIAAQRGLSISVFLAEELERATERTEGYQIAMASALAHLASPVPLGGKGGVSREAMHRRKGLR